VETKINTVLALLLILAGCKPQQPEAEPIIQGKPLKEWLQAAQDPNPQVRAQSVPALVEGLTNEQGHVRTDVITALINLGTEAEAAAAALAHVLVNKRGHDASQARKGLVAIGAKSVPTLIKWRADSNRLQDSERVRTEIDGVLRELGSKAVPELILLLKHDDPALKANAGDALRMLDPQAAAKEGVR
jgi:HEAT repeat protein